MIREEDEIVVGQRQCLEAFKLAKGVRDDPETTRGDVECFERGDLRDIVDEDRVVGRDVKFSEVLETGDVLETLDVVV